jgi:hypothetical protein
MWRHKSGATLKLGRPTTSKLTLKDPIGKGSRQGARARLNFFSTNLIWGLGPMALLGPSIYEEGSLRKQAQSSHPVPSTRPIS